MKSKKYGMMLAVLAAAGGVSASAAPVPVYELKGLTVTANPAGRNDKGCSCECTDRDRKGN